MEPVDEGLGACRATVGGDAEAHIAAAAAKVVPEMVARLGCELVRARSELRRVYPPALAELVDRHTRAGVVPTLPQGVVRAPDEHIDEPATP